MLLKEFRLLLKPKFMNDDYAEIRLHIPIGNWRSADWRNRLFGSNLRISTEFI